MTPLIAGGQTERDPNEMPFPAVVGLAVIGVLASGTVMGAVLCWLDNNTWPHGLSPVFWICSGLLAAYSALMVYVIARHGKWAATATIIKRGEDAQ